jgi:hypothetical protein
MPFLAIAMGALFAFYGPSLGRQYVKGFRRTYRRPAPFPGIWGHFFRIIGVLFLLAGVAMLLGIGVER